MVEGGWGRVKERRWSGGSGESRGQGKEQDGDDDKESKESLR